MTSIPSTILGIDPGTKYLGAAVIRGRELLAYGVHTLRNGERPHDVIGQARHVILSYIQEHSPAVVAIEKPLLVPTKRAALVSVIAQELQARSEELGIRVVEMSPQDARRIVVGSRQARKYDVAHAIVRMGFEKLAPMLPKRPPHPVLGFKPRDSYWLHVFDALAVAIGCERLSRSRGIFFAECS
jgi:Holliday junction resolvasome RuvABC endonuclease subunit